MNSEHEGKCRGGHHGPRGRKGGGPSSAWLHAPQMVLGNLPLQAGHVFVDLGCGVGEYAIEAAKIVGPAGRVYAFDKQPHLIDNLSKTAETLGLENITALTADITAPVPMQDDSAEVVFIATVLHIFKLDQVGPSLFAEAFRILKPGGRLAVIECKKEDQSFGPPRHIRNAPEEVEAVAAPCGFRKVSYTDLGYNYLIQFSRED